MQMLIDRLFHIGPFVYPRLQIVSLSSIINLEQVKSKGASYDNIDSGVTNPTDDQNSRA